MIYYIGHSLNNDIRWKSSSGGIGSQIIQYLLESGEFDTSMTFVFNQDKCQYEPKLIYGYKEYNNCGSIYQDTDTIGFIRNNINNIKNGIVVTCMPCQVKAIRSILERNNIKHFIVSLCCSGQTIVQGTWCYYRLLGIRKEDVNNIQYRGNGWPSGIQIELKNGDVIKKDNYTYPWTPMHESLLYRPKRCQKCFIKTTDEADISLADPWLKEYIENDTIGNSIIICNEKGRQVVKALAERSLIWLNEINKDIYIESQLGTIEAKEKAKNYKTFNKLVIWMGRENSTYKAIVTSSPFFMKIHLLLLKSLRKILKR